MRKLGGRPAARGFGAEALRIPMVVSFDDKIVPGWRLQCVISSAGTSPAMCGPPRSAVTSPPESLCGSPTVAFAQTAQTLKSSSKKARRHQIRKNPWQINFTSNAKSGIYRQCHRCVFCRKLTTNALKKKSICTNLMAQIASSEITSYACIRLQDKHDEIAFALPMRQFTK